MKRSTENRLARRFRPRAAMPDEGKLCLAASGGCLSIGAVGWMLGTAIPEVANLSALLVVGALYLLLAVPSLLAMMRPQRSEDVTSGKVAGAAESAQRGDCRHRPTRSAA